MNLPLNETIMANLQEATRLTQAGRLQEATALIQQALNGESPADNTRGPHHSASQPQATGETFDGSCHVVDEQPEAAQEAPHSQKTTRTESAHADKPRRPFAASPNLGGLGNLLRDKLAGLQGLDTRSVSPAESLAEGALFINGTFSNHAGSRDYKLYVPSGYHGQPLPLVVMLHGCTQDPDDFAAGTGMNTLAETQPCLVLYPAQPTSANHSKCWNWFKPSDQQREHGEPSIIAGMTRQVIDEYHLDEERVYLAGLSAGGAMATTLAMTYPDLYTAVGIHSGLPHGAAKDLPSALAAMQGGSGPLATLDKQAKARAGSSTAQAIPAIIFHGDRDTTVHPSNGDRVAAQYDVSPGLEKASGEDNGIAGKSSTAIERGRVPDGHAYTCTTRQDAKGRTIVEQWSIHGAGHAWSGGTPRGSYTDPKGPNATREMLRFFLSHTKSGLSAAD